MFWQRIDCNESTCQCGTIVYEAAHRWRYYVDLPEGNFRVILRSETMSDAEHDAEELFRKFSEGWRPINFTSVINQGKED